MEKQLNGTRARPRDGSPGTSPGAWIRPGLVASIIVLGMSWALIIGIVNPCGEFSINDDWSFVKTWKALDQRGEMTATGWGKGGPSAIVHVLWGGAFVKIFGDSLTNYRISVLCLAVAASLALLLQLRLLTTSYGLALLGSLTVVGNPLFLSQSFTFMTDVTFAAFMIFSLFWLHIGVARTSLRLVSVGMVFALASILTRQLGVVIPVAFVAATLLHPKRWLVNRGAVFVIAVGVVFLPWVSYEIFLYLAGSTPLLEHDVVQHIWRTPMELGATHYVILLIKRIGELVLYICLLSSPVLALALPDCMRSWDFKAYFVGATVLFAVAEVAILTGVADLPVRFPGNVLFDLGIGPILLKDVNLLKIPRMVSIPKSIYYLLLYWAVLCAGVTAHLGVQFLKGLYCHLRNPGISSAGFISSVSLIALVLYVCAISLTGFFDRYIIPACILLVVWFFATAEYSINLPVRPARLLLCLVPLVVLGVWSVAALHDFMELKRAQTKAQDFLVNDLKVNPCNIDGGFEFNGYHCYRRDFHRKPGLSWWWVKREEYLLALGPIRGYRTVKRFPFNRYVGHGGAVYVLHPEHHPQVPSDAGHKQAGTGREGNPQSMHGLLGFPS